MEIAVDLSQPGRILIRFFGQKMVMLEIQQVAFGQYPENTPAVSAFTIAYNALVLYNYMARWRINASKNQQVFPSVIILFQCSFNAASLPDKCSGDRPPSAELLTASKTASSNLQS